MLNRFTVISFAAALAAAPHILAQAPDLGWRIDSNHSAAHFGVRHFVISTVRGDFFGVTGAVRFDRKDLTKATIDAAIDCATLTTGVAARDDQMKTSDFFDIKKYPKMTFKSTKVEVVKPGQLRVTGNLTINATTRPVVLDVNGPSQEIQDERGNTKVGLDASTKVNRKDFGIVWNTADLAVADEVAITLDIELIKNKPAAPDAAKKP